MAKTLYSVPIAVRRKHTLRWLSFQYLTAACLRLRGPHSPFLPACCTSNLQNDPRFCPKVFLAQVFAGLASSHHPSLSSNVISSKGQPATFTSGSSSAPTTSPRPLRPLSLFCFFQVTHSALSEVILFIFSKHFLCFHVFSQLEYKPHERPYLS